MVRKPSRIATVIPNPDFSSGVEPHHQMVRVLTHGFVHLLGHDHITSEEDTAMLLRETRLLAALPCAVQDAVASTPMCSSEATGCPAVPVCCKWSSIPQLPPPRFLPALGDISGQCGSTSDGTNQSQAQELYSSLLSPCLACHSTIPRLVTSRFKVST
jgi:hypothetical protein